MADWEEKLEGILSNPQAMGQIMALAQSLEGNSSTDTADTQALTPETLETEHTPFDPGNLLSGINQLDPKLLSIAGTLMSQMSRRDDNKTALLQALRPFVRPERYAKLDRAIQIARLSTLLHSAIQLLKEREDTDV